MRVPAPMIAGPRTIEFIELARRLRSRRGLRSRDSASTSPSMRGSIVSRTSRLHSSSGSFLPVSIHQPSSTSCRTRVPVVDQPLDRVGDLELAPGRRLDRAHRLVDRWVEEVHADEREVGRRVGGLLDEPHDLAVGVDLGHAELAGIVDVREQDLRGRSARPSPSSSGRRALGARSASTNARRPCCEHVVAEVHDEVVVAEEVAGDQHAVREPERRVLGDVGDLDAELRAVADARPRSRRAVSPTTIADLLDAGRGHVLDAVEEDRLVGDRAPAAWRSCG